ncbi:MAG: multicopper oxidase family protein [Elainellaceae cyanobacterium]
MRHLTRRQFLTLSAGSLGATVLTRCVSYPSQGRSPRSSTDIAQWTSTDGLLEAELEARLGTVTIGEQTANLMSYNGQIPGPRLEARPGDRVNIRFTNALPDPTNIHYHGLHVPPTGHADNVFLEVSPNETLTYEFTIPDDHPAGVFYYHPHLHGYVADQVFGGLGGIFVVRGDLDDIPELQAADEAFLFLKDVAIADSNQPRMGRMIGREGNVITINGQVNPSFSISSGGLLRLRLVNASNARFYRLSLEDHRLYLVATDAGAIAQPVELQELLLAPGERAEVLVRGEHDSGHYRLLNLPYDRGRMGMMGGPMMGGPMMDGSRRRPRQMGPSMMDGYGDASTQPLATLSYSGHVDPLPLPQRLIPVNALSEPQEIRSFTLNHGMAPGRGMVFLINGRPFDSDRIDTQVNLGAIEEWDILNTGVMDHPFHLHTNRFQVVSRNGQPEPYPAWKDTILVPAGESARIRVSFNDFAGKTVYHCHILDHEDLGMMGTIEMQT